MHGRKGVNQGEVSKDDFYVMKRGDVQFTTGGTGIAHAEENENEREEVHFLQIWATPWRKGLRPRYHTQTFNEAGKRNRFLPILSPLKGGIKATAAEEEKAEPLIEGTIPIHADFVMGASIIDPGEKAAWRIGGGDAVEQKEGRKVYVHLPIRKLGAKVRLAGENDAVLSEGDGAFVEKVKAGDELVVESVGDGEAEVVVLDSN